MEQDQGLSKITIVTATRNRHAYLERIIDYYSSFNVRMLVADETKEKYNKKLPPNVTYHHYPVMPYLSRLNDILSKVTTTYTVLCSDDDFIVPSGIEKCIDFLDSNTEYNSAQGNYTFFYHSLNKIFYKPAYVGAAGYDFYENSPFDRIRKFNTVGIQFFYCVHRTETLKIIFKFLEKKIANLNLAELVMGMCTLIDGKHKVLPIFYSARQSLYGSSGSAIGVNKISTSAEYKDEYNLFINEISLLLSNKVDVPLEDAEAFFNQSMLDFINFRYPNRPSLKKNILAFIKKIIPFKVRKKWRHYFLVLIEKKNRGKNIELALKSAGYPYIIDTPANKELKKIENYIFKFNIQQ